MTSADVYEPESARQRLIPSCIDTIIINTISAITEGTVKMMYAHAIPPVLLLVSACVFQRKGKSLCNLCESSVDSVKAEYSYGDGYCCMCVSLYSQQWKC